METRIGSSTFRKMVGISSAEMRALEAIGVHELHRLSAAYIDRVNLMKFSKIAQDMEQK